LKNLVNRFFKIFALRSVYSLHHKGEGVPTRAGAAARLRKLLRLCGEPYASIAPFLIFALPGTGIATEIKARIKNLSKREIDDLFWDDLQDLYEQRPVDIDTFLENPYFMGEHFADPNTGACKIYPFWREKLREIYPSPFYNDYNEVLVMLGIGNGKSTISNISCLYEIYKLLCLKDPARETWFKNNPF